MLGGTTRNQDSHIQQTPDNQLRLQEILTLILETLGQKQGWWGGDRQQALLNQGKQELLGGAGRKPPAPA